MKWYSPKKKFFSELSDLHDTEISEFRLRWHTSIIVINESERRSGPTEASSVVSDILEAKSSLERVSTWISHILENEVKQSGYLGQVIHKYTSLSYTGYRKCTSLSDVNSFCCLKARKLLAYARKKGNSVRLLTSIRLCKTKSTWETTKSTESAINGSWGPLRIPVKTYRFNKNEGVQLTL